MAKPSPAPKGRKTSAQGKAHRAAALGQRLTKKPNPERATQSAEDILLDDADLEIAAFPGATAPGKVSIKPVAKKTPAKKVAIKTIRKIPRNR
jgi:hypothetical protein